MLTVPSSSPSSSSFSFYPRKYPIFLSFSGEERTKFAGHVYGALQRRTIKTFRDSNDLERGEKIKPGLMEAIEESWGSIIIFSEGYVFSSWCLDELVEILKQSNKSGHQVFPIFYNIRENDLRYHKRSVAAAFVKHKEENNEEKIKMWKYALFRASHFAGWALREHEDELEFIEEFIDRISRKLSATLSCWENLCPQLNTGQDVRLIRISGETGISKTDMAKVAYTRMSPFFEAKCFLPNVGIFSTNELVSLQKLLLSQIFPEEIYDFSTIDEGSKIISQKLSQKKVLIVLEGVNDIKQLNYTVGKRQRFASGSRIIVATKNDPLMVYFEAENFFKLTTTDAEKTLKVTKVQMGCEKCRRKAFETVARIAGVTGVTFVGLESVNNDKISVIGRRIDAVYIISVLRRKFAVADFIMVGPAKRLNQVVVNDDAAPTKLSRL